jgi:hypothetical protein
MNAQNELTAFRNNVKDSICSMLVSIYLAKHNGVMPDWSRGEEIIVEDTDSDNCHTTIMLNVGNTYDECVAPYEVCIDRFIVTRNESLYLYSTENSKEYYWENVNTDDIVKIHDLIARYYKLYFNRQLKK